MAEVALVLAIQPGKQEAWRRFCQALRGSRRAEHEAAQARLGITRGRVWWVPGPGAGLALLRLETGHPAAPLAALAGGPGSFDGWLRAQLLDLHGLALLDPAALGGDLVLEWPLTHGEIVTTIEENTAMNTLEIVAPETTAANKDVIRRFFELAWAQADFGMLDEMLVEEYMHHDAALPPEWQRGREAYKNLTGAFHAAFPDLRVTVDDLVADGDRVAARWTWQGTHTGPFQGMPATGRAVGGPGLSIHRLAGGRLAETWIAFDALGLMQQLGALPQPGGEG